MTGSLAVLLAAVSSWTTPHVLSNGAIALGPELALTSSGAGIAVWDHEVGPDCAQAPASLTCAHVVEAAARSQSGGWTWVGELARPGIGARPQVALNDSGRAIVVWVHDIGRDRVVQATYRTGAAEQFPNPSDVSAAVLEVKNHEAGLDAAGNGAVVWAERHDQEFDVAAEIRSVASGTWGAPVVLSRGAVAAGPALAVTPQGDAYAVWVERAEVYVAHGDLARGVWDAPAALAASGGEAAGQPVIAADAAGDVVAAWWTLESPRGERTVQAAYKAAGQGWRVSNVGNGTTQDVAIGPTGSAAVAWASANGELNASVRPGGGPWSRPERVAARGTDSQLALSAHDDAVAVFRQGPELVASLRPASAKTWQPLERLSGGDPTSVDVALDAAGNGVAIWNLRNGDALPVMTADLSVAAWTPTLANTRRPTVRGRARVGRTVTCNSGEWAGTIPITYTYAWLRNGRARGRGSTYRVRGSDLGAGLACRVSATNAAGTRSVASAPVRVQR